MEKTNKTDCPWDWSQGRMENWEYFFIQFLTAYNTHGRTLLIAKVESPDSANRVGRWPVFFSASLGNVSTKDFHAPSNHEYFKNKALKPKCSTITKWETIKKAEAGNTNCVYTDSSQLFYIIDIE